MSEISKGIRFFLSVAAAGFVLSAGNISAELVARLPHVENPFFLTIADGRMYIVEDAVSVHIYTIDSQGVSFVKSFGRQGQGPGEFNYMYGIRVFPDYLEIPGYRKLARFSPDGDYISEIKISVSMFKGAAYKLDDSYVIRSHDFNEQGTQTAIRLYDKDFKLIKEIGSRTVPFGLDKVNLVSDYYAPRVSGNRIYVINASEESVVSVYDRRGVQLEEIRLPLEPVRMTPALREAIIEPVKEALEGRIPWDEYEKRLFFPKQTPGLDYFEVKEGYFITRTYKYTQDLVEFVIFDLGGRELRRLDLLFTGRLSNGYLFCFYQGRYYYLRWNTDKEGWELHAENANW